MLFAWENAIPARCRIWIWYSPVRARLICIMLPGRWRSAPAASAHPRASGEYSGTMCDSPASRSGDAVLPMSVASYAYLFQSAPGLTVGRCHSFLVTRSLSPCFNPRPASRSGDALASHEETLGKVVSIRARPHGRAMLGRQKPCIGNGMFQSAPGLTVGRCRRAAA